MFRINLFLKINIFFRGIFLSNNNKTYLETITSEISNQSKKKKVVITNSCRVGFLYLLKYFRSKFVKVMPTEYRRALEEIKLEQASSGVAAE